MRETRGRAEHETQKAVENGSCFCDAGASRSLACGLQGLGKKIGRYDGKSLLNRSVRFSRMVTEVLIDEIRENNDAACGAAALRGDGLLRRFLRADTGADNCENNSRGDDRTARER